MPGPTRRDRLGLPTVIFLYTRDQIATMLGLRKVDEVDNYLFCEGRSPGVPPRDKMVARNIAPAGQRPEWRVGEDELVRWMRYKGFTSVLRTWRQV